MHVLLLALLFSASMAVDVTVYHNGYHADLNETFFVGKVDDETSRLVRNAYDCLMAAMAACKNSFLCVLLC